VSGGEHKTKKVVLKGDKVHPSVERAVKIIKESFQKLCLEDQDILGKKEICYARLLHVLIKHF
jgi:hypothetical protein